MAVLLGFSASISGVEYPAAIFKLDKGDGYCWPGDKSTDGTLVVLDLMAARKEFFSGSWEEHNSRHRSGQRHQTLVSTGRRVHVGVDQDVATDKMQSWSSIRSVTAPLVEPFAWWPINMPTWTAIKSPHRLGVSDFGSSPGVTLHGFICRHRRAHELVARWRVATRSWTARHGGFRIGRSSGAFSCEGRGYLTVSG
jgi:hypothetical protein